MIDLKLTIIFGVIIGLIDIIPMIINKIDRNFIISAFAFHLIMPTLVFNLSFVNNWYVATLTYVACTLPLAILVHKWSKKDPIIMIISSLVIGSITGLIIFSVL